jgi:isoleucyl-tRNA synthetase
MEAVLKAVVMGRACRNTANIKNRQPISTMFIKAPFELGEFYKEIIEDELNVKKVIFTDDVRDFTTYTFKPQLKTVGPKYGKQLGGIRTTLSQIDGNKAMDELKANGYITFDVNGVEVKLTEEDLLIDISQKEGYVTEADNTVTVVLDTNLTDDLIEEGYVYEIISKIQTMRKDSDFEVMDHINVYISGNEKIAAVVKKNAAAISEKVLANSFIYEAGSTPKEWNINGESVTLGVEKVK